MDLVELLVHPCDDRHEPFHLARPLGQRGLVHLRRDGLEGVVGVAEDGVLGRELLGDVPRRHEDGLEIHPFALHPREKVGDLADAVQRLFPVVDLVLEGAVEFAGLHGRHVDGVVFEHLVEVVGQDLREVG